MSTYMLPLHLEHQLTPIQRCCRALERLERTQTKLHGIIVSAQRPLTHSQCVRFPATFLCQVLIQHCCVADTVIPRLLRTNLWQCKDNRMASSESVVRNSHTHAHLLFLSLHLATTFECNIMIVVHSETVILHFFFFNLRVFIKE